MTVQELQQRALDAAGALSRAKQAHWASLGNGEEEVMRTYADVKEAERQYHDAATEHWKAVTKTEEYREA